MKPETLVVADASALVAALTVGSDIGEWARAALVGVAIAMPEAGLVETANVLRRLVLRRALSPLEATLAHQDLLDLPIETWSYRLLARRAWDLRDSLTIPDGTYVALAELLGAPLLTADARLQGARDPVRVHRRVALGTTRTSSAVGFPETAAASGLSEQDVPTLTSRRTYMAFQRSSRSLAAAATAAACALVPGAPAASAAVRVLPLAAEAPDSALATASTTAPTCTTPAPTVRYAWLHCHTPAQIRAAYGVDQVKQQGAGQTIVLVDSYGSPTAKQDLQYFHDTFFPTMPNPDFQQIAAGGGAAQTYDNTCKGNGQSGPSAASNWAGEATLDIEWAYAVAPLAKIRLVATAPAETLGVQGFPAIFKAVSDAIDTYDSGTVFSFSLGVSEQTFGGAAAGQTAKFDAVFRKGLAKGDTFFASSGDSGSDDVTKQHRGTVSATAPVVGWPASSPYVTAVGGTQLQDTWTWDPQSDVPFTADGNYNPAYFQASTTGASEPTWDESWLPSATGGGMSAIYPRPAWQASVAGVVGPSRGVPDLSWNAAVDGGVLVYTSFYPSTVRGDGCNRVGWHLYGGTSASSPQVAALTALANEARRTAGKAPIGFLNPQLYTRPDLGPSATPAYDGGGAFRDILPRVYGNPSILSGHLVNNQMFDYNGDGVAVTRSAVPGYPVLNGYDLTNGWGTPRAPQYIAGLVAATPVAAP